MAYRRSYGYGSGVKRYRPRAVSRVRTVTGKSASFIKLPSYKNMAYRGNERSGVLHEIKFVKQIPLNFEITDVDNRNYAFLYLDCMAELIASQDFLKYAAQYQDYCPYAVTVSAACPVSLVGNSLLTDRLYDWPYFSQKVQASGGLIQMSTNNSILGTMLINPGQFYTVASLPTDQDFPVTLETFDSFFASHSTSKKLWNANIPYGVRYARYYATSAQKAQVCNILQDAVVNYSYNDLPEYLAANVQSDVGSYNLLYKTSKGTIASMANKFDGISYTLDNPSNQTIYPVRQTDPLFTAGKRSYAIYSYLWSMQRSKKGQFNPFYYCGVNLNQTQLSSTNRGKQVLTLTFKFYVYFKNEITDFFRGVLGAATPGGDATSGEKAKLISTVNGGGVQNGNLTQQALLQRAIANFRTNRQFLSYTTNSLANQLVQLTIPEIYRQQLQRTFLGNYLLSYYRDDVSTFGSNRNGFYITEDCWNERLQKYVFQGYIDLMPNGNSTYLQYNQYEPDAETTDSKFVTHYGQEDYSTTVASDMQDINVQHTCPQWNRLLQFDDLTQTYNSSITSTYAVAPVMYSGSGFEEFTGAYFNDIVLSASFALGISLNFQEMFVNIANLDPYFYSQIQEANVVFINAGKIYDNTNQEHYYGQDVVRYDSMFTYTTETDSDGHVTCTPNFDYRTANSYFAGLYAQYMSGLQGQGGAVPADVLAAINKCLLYQNATPIPDVQTALNSIYVFSFAAFQCPQSQSIISTYSYDVNNVDAGYLYPFVGMCIPAGVFTNGQIVVLDQLIKDFVSQSQSFLVANDVIGYDPTAVELSELPFAQQFNLVIPLTYDLHTGSGWYLDSLDFQVALNQAQNTFQQSIPSTASKVWKKVKGFLQKAWSAAKRVGLGVIKIVGGTAAAAFLPGGSAVASALIPSGIKDITSEVTSLVISRRRKRKHYVNGRLAGITSETSTGLVKVLITPGVCALSSAQPVNLDSTSFIDQNTVEVSSIDIGDYSDSRVTATRFKHNFGSLSSYKVLTEDGEEVDASFVQTRLKVQVYMDKPSPDFVLPDTFVGIDVNNYYTEQEQTQVVTDDTA